MAIRCKKGGNVQEQDFWGYPARDLAALVTGAYQCRLDLGLYQKVKEGCGNA